MHVVMIGDYPVSPNKISGGVESVTLYLTQALQKYPDLKLDVITLDRWGIGAHQAEHGQVTVHYAPFARLPGRLSILANIRQMKQMIRNLKPDIVHAHIAGHYAEAAAGAGLPWVLTLHGIRFLEASLWPGLVNKYRQLLVKREEFRAVGRARHIISISPFIQATFNGHIRGEIYNIENPIAGDFFELPLHGNPKQLLFVGRLIPRKGVLTLLQAFARVHQQIPDLRLRLAGGGISPNDPASYYHELQQFVANHHLDQAVTFLGELDEAAILEEYANCSALVLSSVLETAPMVLLQALAAGRAVVSTDAGGSRYLIKLGQTGLVTPAGDAPALAEALYDLFRDEARLRRMGQQAREDARQRFHADVVAAQTRDVYFQVLGQGKSNSTGDK